MKQAIAKFSVDGKFRIPYATKAGIKCCFFYDGGFKRKRCPDQGVGDVLPQYRVYDAPQTLAGRLRTGICELCSEKAGNLVMHHIRRMSDLTDHNAWERLMKEKRRKTLAACLRCHDEIHRP